jgi:hypothetical protein
MFAQLYLVADCANDILAGILPCNKPGIGLDVALGIS